MDYFGAMSRYFDFSGRATRREYWWFQLALIFLLVGGICFDVMVLGYYGRMGDRFGPLTLFVIFFHFIPSFSVTARRLHDAGKSGWWYFITLVPLIGSLWLLYLTLKGPDDRSDDFGPDPRFEQPAPRGQRQQVQTRSQLLIQQMEERRRRMSA